MATQPTPSPFSERSSSRPCGGSISPRQLLNLLIELLETQVEAQFVGVLHEQPPNGKQVFGRLGVDDLHFISSLAAAIFLVPRR